MKTAYDVVVIGGGVVGLSVARTLARTSYSVAVLEKGAVGREASWAGAGLLSPLDVVDPSPVVGFHDYSLLKFETFCRELREESGIDPEFQRCGEYQFLFDESDIEQAVALRASFGDRLSELGSPPLELIDGNEARSREPRLAPGVQSVLVCRHTAQCRTTRLMAALATSCRSHGVDLIEGCAAESLLCRPDVESVSVEDDSLCVEGVVTASGRIAARWVVLAAGSWSSEIANWLGRLVPVYPVRGQMILLKTKPGWLGRIVTRQNKYLVPRNDGRILLGATVEPESGFSKRVTPHGMSSLIAAAQTMCPSVSELEVEANWSGLRPGTPDGLPHIGKVRAGLLAATGHFRTGLTLAPATADSICALVSGEPMPMSLDFCRPGRESTVFSR